MKPGDLLTPRRRPPLGTPIQIGLILQVNSGPPGNRQYTVLWTCSGVESNDWKTIEGSYKVVR